MHRTIALVLVAGIFLANPEVGDDLVQPRTSASHIVREQARIRAHFDSVLVELRARDVAKLTPNQQAARADLTAWLAEYRDAGRFPLNDRYAVGPTPIFRDARGTTCAMAYLVERSGRLDLVDDIASHRNLDYIAALADDPRLVAWLDSTGLGVEEAGRIQPAYGPPPDTERDYVNGAITFSSVSLGMSVWNMKAPGTVSGAFGMAVGGLSMLVGLEGLWGGAFGDRTDKEGLAGALSITAGGLSVFTGIMAMRKNRPTGPVAPARTIDLEPVIGVAPNRRQLALGFKGTFR
jgi:hypothetical protein